MGLFRSSTVQDEEVHGFQPSAPADAEETIVHTEKAPAVRASSKETVLGQGQVFEGNLSGEGSVRLEGMFKGDIRLQGVVSISMSGSLVGTIEANNVFISGSVDGDITAHGKLRLACGCKVHGDVKSLALAVEDGASFDGRCAMLEDGSHAPAEPVGAALPPLEDLQFGRNYSPEDDEALEDGAESEDS